jgi:hypothetical protein
MTTPQSLQGERQDVLDVGSKTSWMAEPSAAIVSPY